MSLGEYEGKHYGLPLDVNLKSNIWYNIPAWEAAGWGDFPETWDELIALATEMADQERILPRLSEGQGLDATRVEALGRTTQPPPRYTEASLVKTLEEYGIGRPSTYATFVGYDEIGRPGVDQVEVAAHGVVVCDLEGHRLCELPRTLAFRPTDHQRIAAGQRRGERRPGGAPRRAGLHARQRRDARLDLQRRLGWRPPGHQAQAPVRPSSIF